MGEYGRPITDCDMDLAVDDKLRWKRAWSRSHCCCPMGVSGCWLVVPCL